MHPAGESVGVGKAAVWYGREVEGSLACSTTPTAFIDKALTADQMRDLDAKLVWREVSHVFLTEGFSDWDWFADRLLPACDASNVVITVATMSGPRVEWLLGLDFSAKIRLMVRASFDAPWVSKLRPGDQVSVGVPYDMLTWEVEDGVRSKPADYEGDYA